MLQIAPAKGYIRQVLWRDQATGCRGKSRFQNGFPAVDQHIGARQINSSPSTS